MSVPNDNRSLFVFEQGLCATEIARPAETKERPPILDLCQCQCRCCGCVCVSSRGKESRENPFNQKVDSTLFRPNENDDSDARYSDRIAAQEGVENVEDHTVPWIEAVMDRLTGWKRATSPDIHESMDGAIAPPTSPESPGMGSPNSTCNSMYNEVNSGSRSMSSSMSLSIYEVLSQSGLLTGVGGAAGDVPYTFTADPLRLSYEEEHCHSLDDGKHPSTEDDDEMF